jgi:long-chain acyl-CoA synthetase
METIVDLIRESGRRFDRRPALLIKPGFRTRRWRFGELAALTPKVARVFADHGIEPGDRVLIWAVNRPEWCIAFLGAVHAGAVLVPLDVRSAPDFINRIIEQTQPKLVIASQQTADGARSLGLPILWIETLPDLAREATPLPDLPIGPDDLAEVIFTSGTTGDPKGVMLTQRNIVSNASTLVHVFPFQDDERLLSILPLSHMFGQVPCFLAPLAAGAAVVFPVSRQPSVLMRTFRDFRVTMLLIVPQGMRLLDNAIERQVDSSGKREMFERLHRWARRVPRIGQRLLFRPVLSRFGGRLRTIAIGGSAMDPAVADRWTEMGIEVLQGYGATEMSPVVSFTRPGRNRIGSVGEAIPGVEIRLADDGEILVRGPNRFIGYWENPDATAAAIDADGWYHTGDIGELSGDGFLTLRGRKKDMLALPDGQKVYPEDVENALVFDPRVKDATVVGYPPGQDLKVHAVLLLEDAKVADAVIRDANARLGAHQQIRAHTVWPDDDFPRTLKLSIKKRIVLDRLAELETAKASGDGKAPAQEGAAAGAVPAGTLAQVSAFIAQVAAIPVTSVQPESRLSTDLGLDSLGRVEVLGVIEEELGVFLDDGALDPEATVAQLAEMVDASRNAPREEGIYGWPLNPLVRALGLAIQELLVVPLLFLFYRVRIRGEERLRGLAGPVLFVPNHHLHTDSAIILTSLPIAWRWRLSVAAAADDIFGNPLKGLGAAVIGNAFPLSREGSVRRSLELLGARLDRDFSILVYPEGKLTVDGPLQPFKAGAGLVAVEGATPVVPMLLKINRLSKVDGWRAPNSSLRGDVEVIFGDPIYFASDTDHLAATAALERAVAALGTEGASQPTPPAEETQPTPTG